MIDLIIIGAIVHFCALGYHLMRAYERFVDAYEDNVYAPVEEDDY